MQAGLFRNGTSTASSLMASILHPPRPHTPTKRHTSQQAGPLYFTALSPHQAPQCSVPGNGYPSQEALGAVENNSG